MPKKFVTFGLMDLRPCHRSGSMISAFAGSPFTRSRATETRNLKRRGPALPGLRKTPPSRSITNGRQGWTLRCWRPYLLNYFEHPTTNAYTEGVHTKIRRDRKSVV